MEQLEILALKLEMQIEQAFNTLVKIQEIERAEWPMRHLSNQTRTELWMIFQSQLIRQLWDRLEKTSLNIEEKKELVTEIWNATFEHYKELYDFDSKKIANNR